jgi:hypothetical protein
VYVRRTRPFFPIKSEIGGDTHTEIIEEFLARFGTPFGVARAFTSHAIANSVVNGFRESFRSPEAWPVGSH